MAVTSAPVTRTRTYTTEERTEEVIITTPRGEPYTVAISRGIYEIEDGVATRVGGRIVHRTLVQMMADADAPSLLSTMPPIFDRWALEDIAAAQAGA